MKTYERYRWDKYQHRLARMHVEEGEEKEGEYIKKGGETRERDREFTRKNTVTFKN